MQLKLRKLDLVLLGAVGLVILAFDVAKLANAQELPGLPAYVVPDTTDQTVLDLVTERGRFPLALGSGCDELGAFTNVLAYPGSRSTAMLTAPYVSSCNVLIGAPILDAAPCLLNADTGVCDVAGEFPQLPVLEE